MTQIKLTPRQVILGNSACLLGIIQGVAWFAMSLTCIIVYCLATPPKSPSADLEYFNQRVYYFYLHRATVLPVGTIVTSGVFLSFMCIYTILTTVWIVGSCFMFNVLRKRTLNVPVMFKDWAIITFLISILDLILVILLGVDYNDQCLPGYGEDTCVNTTIPVLVIAARGFVLWLVNVIVAVMLITNARFLRKDNDAYQKTLGGILPVFEFWGHIPRAHVSKTPTLYSQQLSTVDSKKSFWSLNLRPAMDRRIPPPISPTSSRSEFWTRL